MAMSDPIADMITKIRNAQRVNIETIKVQYSRIKENILSILKDEHFISKYEIIEENNKKFIIVYLKYNNKRPVITHIRRISKPSRRIYIKANEIKPVLNNRGISIVSTSKGIMIGRKAKKLGVGGEVLIEVW
ncbi:MAG: 30S ribosomal protein S8 [Leptonema sp. (in: bacteria)]